MSLLGAPMPYEVEFGMPNRFDCIDWARENNYNLIYNLVE
jgi:hypothetical protein